MIIAIDFDGTIVEHEYPKIGAPVPHAIEVVRVLHMLQNKIFLWTMRSGKELDEAVKYLEDNGIQLWGINENPEQKSWTQSPKQYAQMYIDDAALGCPLVKPEGKRPYVDWPEVWKLIFGQEFDPVVKQSEPL